MSPTRVVLIGHPVAHSLSPVMHNAAFAHDGLDWRYEAWDVPGEKLGARVRWLAQDGYAGANVTVPHKTAIVGYLDVCDQTARWAGAVNTVVNDRGRLCGYNTDVAGVKDVLDGLGFHGPGTALVLGAGGAARAVAVALAGLGVTAVVIMNRSRERALAMAASLAGLGLELSMRDFAPPGDGRWAKDLRLVVNATSIGLPGTGTFPFDDLYWVPEGATVLDLVYGAGGTPLGLMPRPPGVRYVPGDTVLVAQGAHAYQLWTGRRAPADVMREAVRAALYGQGGRDQSGPL